MSLVSALVEVLAIVAKAVIERSENETLTIAAEAANAIAAITGAVLSATTGKVTPDQARAEIEKLMAALRANDAAADAELARRFPVK